MSSSAETMTLRLRIRGEGHQVPDAEALLDTLVLRHLERIKGVSRANLHSWVMGALRNQYLAEQSMAVTDIPRAPEISQSIPGSTDGEQTDLPSGNGESFVDDSQRAVSAHLTQPAVEPPPPVVQANQPSQRLKIM